MAREGERHKQRRSPHETGEVRQKGIKERAVRVARPPMEHLHPNACQWHVGSSSTCADVPSRSADDAMGEKSVVILVRLVVFLLIQSLSGCVDISLDLQLLIVSLGHITCNFLPAPRVSTRCSVRDQCPRDPMDSDSDVLPPTALSSLVLNIPGGAPVCPPLVFRRCPCCCSPSGPTSPLGMLANSASDDKRMWDQGKVTEAVNAAGFPELAG